MSLRGLPNGMDKPALLAQPGAHHKALLIGANSLYRDKLIDRDDLCELLELADGALAYAIETQLDIDSDE
jgi:3-oxoacyl-[acyl-carrier-protein] synthase III